MCIDEGSAYVRLSKQKKCICGRFWAKTKKFIESVKICLRKKARLRLNNKARWSSDYLLLKSHHKGYVKGVFKEGFGAPVKREILEWCCHPSTKLYALT